MERKNTRIKALSLLEHAGKTHLAAKEMLGDEAGYFASRKILDEYKKVASSSEYIHETPVIKFKTAPVSGLNLNKFSMFHESKFNYGRAHKVTDQDVKLLVEKHKANVFIDKRSSAYNVAEPPSTSAYMVRQQKYSEAPPAKIFAHMNKEKETQDREKFNKLANFPSQKLIEAPGKPNAPMNRFDRKISRPLQNALIPPVQLLPAEVESGHSYASNNWMTSKPSVDIETSKSPYPDFKSGAQVMQVRQSNGNDKNYNQIKPKVSDVNEVRRGKSLGGKYIKNVCKPFKSPLLTESKVEQIQDETDSQHPLLKGIDPKLIEIIKNEIVDNGTKTSWDDIAGLVQQKEAIQEAVILPMCRPDLFEGLRLIPKGILLFGPPGTGKTLIGKCIASEASATFFSISASTLTSKWVGEGEKLVKALFMYARANQPSVVFIDEIDSILTKRVDGEHESSRRLKTEFMIQLEGANTTSDQDRLLIVGATNRPQELDDAVRRRFTKRLYIPLPEFKARTDLLINLVQKNKNSLKSYELVDIAKQTDGYSGSDIKNLCSEATMWCIRECPKELLRTIDKSELRPTNHGDFLKALKRVKSSVSQQDLQQYIDWDCQFGST